MEEYPKDFIVYIPENEVESHVVISGKCDLEKRSFSGTIETTGPIVILSKERYEALTKPLRTIDNLMDVFIGRSGMVNIAELNKGGSMHGRTTGAIEMKMGERLVVRRGDYLRIELLPRLDDY